jgi:hypothetical protein
MPPESGVTPTNLRPVNHTPMPGTRRAATGDLKGEEIHGLAAAQRRGHWAWDMLQCAMAGRVGIA